jgi:hypothetical protein
MIWFACKQCGKRHQRPDEAAGSLVFCACGQANRVPWESTAPPPEDQGEAPRPRDEDEDRSRAPRRRRAPVRRREPGYCLNHEGDTAGHTCPDCGEEFCGRCVVEFQGRVLCGPCKNLRVRNLQRPARVVPLAIFALVAGLVSAPVLFCVTFTPLGLDASDEARAVWGVVGMILPGVALALSLLALREIESKPQAGGRALALTGAACAVAGLLWSLSVSGVMVSRLLQG